MKRIWFLISVILLCFFSNIAYSDVLADLIKKAKEM